MGSVNKVILVGNLGADPELKYTAQAGKSVCSLSVATNETWKDKSGSKQERVEWHRVQVWGDLAENCAKFLKKGRTVYAEGKLQTRKWEDKNGQTKYTTEILADRVVFLGGSGDGVSADGGSSKRGGWGEGKQADLPSTRSPVNAGDIPAQSDDDIPF